MSDPEIIAYAYKVNGPHGNDWTLRVDFEDPREVWRDDHEIKDVIELANVNQIENKTLDQFADATSIGNPKTVRE